MHFMWCEGNAYILSLSKVALPSHQSASNWKVKNEFKREKFEICKIFKEHQKDI